MGGLKTDLAEIKRHLGAATTLEDVGDIFRMAFEPWAKNKFTKERYEAGEIFADVFNQLVEKEKPTALELYDFLNMSLQCDVEEYQSNEKYKQLIEQGRKINKEQIRDCLIGEGEKIFCSLFEKQTKYQRSKFIIDRASHFGKLLSGKGTIFVDGIKFSANEEPLSGYLQKIGETVGDNLQHEFPKYKNSIPYIASGKMLMHPKNKIERLLLKKINELKESLILEFGDVSKEFKKLIEKYKEDKKRLKEEVEPDAHKFLDELGKSSRITEKDAEHWAKNNIYIAPNVAKKLDDLAYPADQLRKDMAELYRYVGGKLGPVEFVVRRGTKRAWANGRATICLDNDFTKKTLFHECGHLVEHWDDASLQGSLAFIKGRATGEPKSLKALTGGGYRPDEKAYPDNFIDPYVGKIYSASSEVFSMGLQHLASIEDMYALANKDPEHFKLLMGQCIHKNPLLAYKAKQLMDETSAHAKEKENKQQRIDVFLKALDKAVDAISPALEIMLLDADEGMPGFSLKNMGRNDFFLYWNEGDRKWATLLSGKRKDALRAAYLHLLGHNGQLPISYNPLDHTIVDSIKNYALGSEVPEWFDPVVDFPTLNLGEEFAQKAKSENEKAKSEAIRKKAFKKALKEAIPDWLESELCDGQGIDGYEMSKTNTSKASVYSEHHYSKYLATEKKDVCLILAYLLICNHRNILPQNYGPDGRAIYQFIDFAKGKKIPDWFNENTKFPSLE